MDSIKLSFAVVLLLFSSIAQADIYTTDVYIDSIETFGNGDFWVTARYKITTKMSGRSVGVYHNEIQSCFVSKLLVKNTKRPSGADPEE